MTERPFAFVGILYAARSGSTFLARELSNRYDILFAPESNFITNLFDLLRGREFAEVQDVEILDCVYGEPKFSDWHIPRSDLLGVLRERSTTSLNHFVRRIVEIWGGRHDTARVGIKKGSYAHYCDELASHFPDNRYIALVRDPRAVFHSQKNNTVSGTGKPFELDVKRFSAQWVAIYSQLEHMSRTAGGVHTVRYEDLIEQPEESLAGIAAALQLRQLDHVTDRYHVPPRYRGKLHANVGRAPLPDRLSAWQQDLSKAEVDTINAACQALMDRYNYPLDAT